MLKQDTQPIPSSDLWPSIERFLSTREFGAVFHVATPTVRKMLRNGQLVGIRTPGGWRICDPGRRLFQVLRDQAVALESVPFIRGIEAAQLLGVSPRRVRQLADQGFLRDRRQRGRRLYTLNDLLNLITSRGRGKRGSGTYVRASVVSWATKQLGEILTLASRVDGPVAASESKINAAFLKALRSLGVDVRPN